METSWRNDQTGKPATARSVDNSCACGDIKTIIAEKLHKAATAVGEKAARQDAQPTIAQYGKQAAEVLEESADYIQQFDYKQEEANVREYVRRKPGFSLLIAGVTGLIIGAIFRRN